MIVSLNWTSNNCRYFEFSTDHNIKIGTVFVAAPSGLQTDCRSVWVRDPVVHRGSSEVMTN